MTTASTHNLFETEESSSALNALAEQRAIQVASMSSHDRVLEFLGWCNRRGSKYLAGIDAVPTLSQLAKYCSCTPSTIYRIAQETTKSPSLSTMRVLRAIACLDPVAQQSDLCNERRSRMSDADRWVDSDPRSRGDVMDAILTGIRDRSASHSN